MIKIVLVVYAMLSVFKVIGNAICHLFRHGEETPIQTTSVSGNWYGICEQCGTKDGLHRFEGKRYCAKCHARLTVEKKFGGNAKRKQELM